jgi:hypothetical protein
MACTLTELAHGGKRYDLVCGYCGHHEREVYTSTGKSVAWINVTLQERVAREKAALAESKAAA